MASGILANDTLFYVRETPWHGLGTRVEEAPNSIEAIRLAGLDWEVVPVPTSMTWNGEVKIIPNQFANVHSRTGDVLGTVTGKYQIVQNEEAFSFTDGLLGDDVRYETAGSLFNGIRVWLLARMPDTQMVGDKFENYLLFVNSHDGKGAIKVVATQVRVVCQNTANMALKGASRSWSTKHMGNMESKMAEAHRTLELAGTYFDAARLQAEAMAAQKLSDTSFELFVKELMPVEKDATKIKIRNIEAQRDELMYRYLRAPDLSSIRGTKWGAFQAVSDFVTHTTPLRLSSKFEEKRMDRTLTGEPVLDRAFDLLTA